MIGITSRREEHPFAFTILELVSTILVLAILATLALFGWRGYVEQARDRTAVANLVIFYKSASANLATDPGSGWKPALEQAARELRWTALDTGTRAAVTQVTLVEDTPLTSSNGFSGDTATISYKVGTYQGMDAIGLATVASNGNCVLLVGSATSVIDAWSTGTNLGAGCTGGLALDGYQSPDDYTFLDPGDYGIPRSPTNLEALATASQVTLTWDASTSTDVVSYKIFRDDLPEPLATWTDLTNLSYVDSTVESATEYSYTVVAVDRSSLESLPSAPALTLTIPAVLTECIATVSPSAITLSWAPASGVVSGYKVFVDGSLVETIPGTTITIDKTADGSSLNTGQAYSVAVGAYNSSGMGEESCQSTQTPIAAPDAPANLAGVPLNGAVDLSWSAVPSTAPKPVTGYRVLRLNPTTGLYEQYAQVTTTTYRDTVVTNGVTYSYRVAAYGAAGQGFSSDAVSVRPAAPAQAPTVDEFTFAEGEITVWFTVNEPSTAPVDDLTLEINGVERTDFDRNADSYTAKGLTVGQTYEFTFRASNEVGGSSITRQATAIGVPQAPSPFTVEVSPSSGAELNLAWGAVPSTTERPVTGYRVFRLNTVSGLYEQVAQQTGTTLTDTGLTAGTEYSYRVSTYGTAGEGTKSSAVQQTPVNRPTNATVSAQVSGDRSVDVTWTSAAATAATPISGFRIYQDGALLRTVAAGSSSTTVTGLTAGQSYTFRVRPYNAAGEPASTTAGESATITAVTLPAAPTGFTVDVNTTSGARLDLSWNAVASTASAPVTGYRVFRLNPLNGLYEQVAQQTGTTLTDTGLTAGNEYSYRVATYGTGGQGVQTSTVSQTPVNRPANVTLSAAIGGDKTVNLSWTSAAATAATPISGFRIYQDGSLVRTVLASASSASITGLTAGQSYTFRVRPYNAAGEPASTTAGESATITAVTLPAAPTGFTVDVNTTSGARLDLSWNAVTSTSAAPVSGYRVFRLNPLNGLYEQVAQQTGTTLTDTGLTAGNEYSYRVATYGTGGQGVQTSIVSQTPVNRPANVTLTGTQTSTGDINLSWTSAAATAATPITGFRIYQDGVLLRTVSSGTSSTTITGLTAGQSYTFQVRPFNAAGEPASTTAGESVTLTSVVAPAAPTGFAVEVSTSSGTRLDLSWNAVTSTAGSPVTGYRVFRLNPLNGLYEQVAQQTGTSMADTGLTTGTEYSYRVAAYGAGGQGLQTATVSQTPLNPPLAPTNLGFTQTGAGTLVASWTNNQVNPSAPYSDFTYVLKAGTTTVDSGTLLATATSRTFTGLTAGTEYTLVLRVGNRVTVVAGTTVEAQGAATVTGLPNAPSSLTATNRSHLSAAQAEAQLTWPAVTSVPSAVVSGYRLSWLNPSTGLYEQVYQGTATTVFAANSSATTSSPATVISTLAQGNTYTFRVASYNTAVGQSSSAQASVDLYVLPATPSTPLATAGNGTATATWAAVPSTPAAPVTSITVQRSSNGGSTYTNVDTGLPANTTSYNDSTAQNGTTYVYRVVAVNGAGSSQSAASNAITPTQPPGTAPTGFTVNVPYGTSGSTSATASMSWNAVSGSAAAPVNGYITNYRNPSSGLYEQIYKGSTLSTSQANLAFASTYRWQVAAYGPNPSGSGSDAIGPFATSGDYTPAKPPAAPTNVSINSPSPSTGTITVSFTPGADNGAAISSFTATCVPSSAGQAVITGSGTSSPITVSDLVINNNNTGWTYDCSVTATNAAGTSGAALASNNPYNHYAHYAHYAYGHYSYGHYGYSHYGYAHYGYAHYGYAHYAHYGYTHYSYSHYGYTHYSYSHYRYSHYSYSHYRYSHYGYSHYGHYGYGHYGYSHYGYGHYGYGHYGAYANIPGYRASGYR